MADFGIALDYVIQNEGTKYNPDDTGGPSKFGITKKTLVDYARAGGSPLTTYVISDLELVDAENVYDLLYWKPLMGDLFKSQGIATCLLDTAINRGLQTSIMMAQRACIVQWMQHADPALKVDGLMGPVTLYEINCMDTKSFIVTFEHMEEVAYEAIIQHDPKQLVNLVGWTARAKRMLTLI